MKRFWDKVIKTDDCWYWNASFFKCGYGQFHFKGRAHYAHRIAWMLNNGSIEKGVIIRHKCDNKKCVNPDHLETGTQFENMKDMVSRNRQSKGSKRPLAKLCESDVMEIREMLNTNTLSTIAEKFKVSIATISLIKLKKSWKHVEKKFK